jgi:hypothetical protein
MRRFAQLDPTAELSFVSTGSHAVLDVWTRAFGQDLLDQSILRQKYEKSNYRNQMILPKDLSICIFAVSFLALAR